MTEQEYQQKIPELEAELRAVKQEILNFMAELKGFNRAAHVIGLNELIQEYMPKFCGLRSENFNN
ncbi:MAG: hypothetical protein ACREPR_12295 [Brasilonema sp.]